MRLRPVEWVTAVLLSGFAVGLHALRWASAGPLWRDEAAVAHLSASPTLLDIFQAKESFPPPFFFLVRAWIFCFGGADASLRTFGLLVGIALLVALWWAGRRAASTLPLIGLGLVAMQPMVVIFGDSLRGYGAGGVALAIAFGAFVRLAGSEADLGAVATAALAAVGAAQLSYFDAPLVLALGLAAAGVGLAQRRRRAALVAATIGAGAALSPLIWIGALQSRLSWSSLMQSPTSVGDLLAELMRAGSAPVAALRWVWTLLAVLALFVALRRGAAEPEGDTGTGAARAFALWALPLTLSAQIGIQLLLQYPPRPWYVLGSLCLAALALDVLLSGSAFGRSIRLGVIVLASLALALPALSLARTRMTNMDLAADRVAAEASADDLVLVSPWQLGISYQRYRHAPTAWMTVPELEDHGIHRYDLLKRRMREADPLAAVRRAVERTLREGHDVWLITDATAPPPASPAPALPPAPQSPAGWQESPYLDAWSSQLDEFLRRHAGTARRVPLAKTAPLNGYETVELRAFRGWLG